MRTGRWAMTGAVLASAFFVVSMVGAQTTTRGDARAQSMSRADSKFIQSVLEDNLAEVQLGKLAQEKGGDPQVRQLGERMVADHGGAAKELQQLATDRGVSVNEDLSRSHLRMRDRMAKLQPTAFDREYVREMVKGHKQDVAEFKRMSEKAQDPALKAWVVKTLPTLEDHLQMVENLDRSLTAAKR
jgi:putative membrane protein